MPFDASKVERTRWVYYGHEGYSPFPHDETHVDVIGDGLDALQITVSTADFDACAAALSEARDEVEKLKGIVREYRNSHAQSIRTMTVDMEPVGCIVRIAGLLNGTQIDDRCSICKRADEALGGK